MVWNLIKDVEQLIFAQVDIRSLGRLARANRHLYRQVNQWEIYQQARSVGQGEGHLLMVASRRGYVELISHLGRTQPIPDLVWRETFTQAVIHHQLEIVQVMADWGSYDLKEILHRILRQRISEPIEVLEYLANSIPDLSKYSSNHALEMALETDRLKLAQFLYFYFPAERGRFPHWLRFFVRALHQGDLPTIQWIYSVAPRSFLDILLRDHVSPHPHVTAWIATR